jgi:hypothetical protein
MKTNEHTLNNTRNIINEYFKLNNKILNLYICLAIFQLFIVICMLIMFLYDIFVYI